MAEQESLVEIEQDFDKNKKLTQKICIEWTDKIPKCMRMAARDLHFEVGIVFPLHFNYSNMFNVVEYNQPQFDFNTKANNSFEFFFRKSCKI